MLDAIERDEAIQWNCQSQATPKWIDTNTPNVLDFFSFYRPKPPPEPAIYSAEELLELGIHYVRQAGSIATVQSLCTYRNTITVAGRTPNAAPIESGPAWFALCGYIWSADGKDWHNFRKEN